MSDIFIERRRMAHHNGYVVAPISSNNESLMKYILIADKQKWKMIERIDKASRLFILKVSRNDYFGDGPPYM